MLELFHNSNSLMLYLTFSSLYDQLASHVVVEASLCSYIILTS